MKKIKWKQLLVCMLIPILLGTAVGIITDTSAYIDMIKPILSPPSILFPIVWKVLYILMGISSYIILTSYYPDKEKALFLYISQLIINLIWPILFFGLHLELLAFIWILLLIVIVIKMIYQFNKISMVASLVQIPYLIWLIYAAYLNIGVYILNR